MNQDNPTNQDAHNHHQKATVSSAPSGRLSAMGMAILGAVLLAALLAGVLIGLGIGGRSDTQGDTNVATDGAATSDHAALSVAMTVEAVRPVLRQVAQEISANGSIAAQKTAQVSGRITGVTIEQVLVEVGDVVQAGQVLAVLDASSLKDSEIQAAADLEQALASAEKARADLARTEPLLALDAISRQEVDAYRTALRQADATVIAARAKLNNTKTSLNNTNITAPVSGIISERMAQVGVLASGNPLFTIIKDGALEWQATISPQNATKIRVGQEALIDVGDGVVAGRVTRLSPTANQGREMTVHVALPVDAPLSAGMYQTGRFVLSQSQALSVPRAAMTSTDGHDYVWVLHAKEDGLYQVGRHKVSVLSHQGAYVAVAGVPTDALIVARSAEFLADGDVVRVAMIHDHHEQQTNTQGQ